MIKEPKEFSSRSGFSWKSRGQAFVYAFKGIKYAFRTQHNMWLHSVAAMIAITMGFILNISLMEWFMILACIAAVMALELVNTALEVLVDHLHPQQHPRIGLVKDLAAGAVLVAAVFSCIIACLIFGPGILAYFNIAI